MFLSLAGQHRVEKLLSLSSGVCHGAQLGSCSLPCSARLQGRALSLEQGHGVRCTGEALLEGCSPAKLLRGSWGSGGGVKRTHFFHPVFSASSLQQV